MKRAIAVYLFLVIGLSSCMKRQKEIIADDKKEVARINKNIGDLKSKNVDDIASREPGTITGYYRDEEVRKIYTEHFGEKSRTFSEYYFDDGMLIFVQKKEFIYNRPNTYTEEKARQNNDSEWYDDKKTVLEISSFYFNHNKLIKWYKGNDDMPEGPHFKNREDELWGESLILMKELKEQ